jgi:hypothetical protein
MNFESVLNEHFANTLEESAFVARTLAALAPHGFTADNAIACVAVCRDELCTPLQLEVRQTWGEAFNMSSLAGVPSCGTTAFGAAHAHSPTDQDKERYVYISMAHIGIGPDGERGACQRVGRSGTSKACGAVAALLFEMHSGRVKLKHDPDDLEQSHLRHKVLQRLEWGAKPDLIELTQVVRLEALETLERMIGLTVDMADSDYALFNGIQIHGPGNRTFVWPAVSYVVIDGVRSELELG